MARSSATAHLDAAVTDITALDTLSLEDLAGLYELVEELIAEQYENDAPEPAIVDQLCDVADRAAQMTAERRRWTLFTTCVSSGEWWIEAGESRATQAFERWLGHDPFDRCNQCGDTCFHIVERPLDATPSEGAEVITASAVATLLAASAPDA